MNLSTECPYCHNSIICEVSTILARTQPLFVIICPNCKSRLIANAKLYRIVMITIFYPHYKNNKYFGEYNIRIDYSKKITDIFYKSIANLEFVSTINSVINLNPDNIKNKLSTYIVFS